MEVCGLDLCLSAYGAGLEDFRDEVILIIIAFHLFLFPFLRPPTPFSYSAVSSRLA